MSKIQEPVKFGAFDPGQRGEAFSPNASDGLRIIANGIKEVFLAHPEATIAAAAFLVGMCSPRYEETCEKVAVESLKALAERRKREAQAEAKQREEWTKAFGLKEKP